MTHSRPDRRPSAGGRRHGRRSYPGVGGREGLYQLDHPWPPPPAPPAADIETERGHDQTWQETPLFPHADPDHPNSQNETTPVERS
jgi:hypothetical protein